MTAIATKASVMQDIPAAVVEAADLPPMAEHIRRHPSMQVRSSNPAGEITEMTAAETRQAFTRRAPAMVEQLLRGNSANISPFDIIQALVLMTRPDQLTRDVTTSVLTEKLLAPMESQDPSSLWSILNNPVVATSAFESTLSVFLLPRLLAKSRLATPPDDGAKQAERTHPRQGAASKKKKRYRQQLLKPVAHGAIVPLEIIQVTNPSAVAAETKSTQQSKLPMKQATLTTHSSADNAAANWAKNAMLKKIRLSSAK